MKIKQIHIYGFGKWIDYKIQFSEKQLLCLYGKNESGKSTIQNFIMFMLFGLPPKMRKYYQPKMSSRMGGRIIIEEEGIGQYTIERLDGIRNGAAICYFPNGEEKDNNWLQNRLNGMTSSIYKAIFSFSALDLINIKQMKDEDLGDILLTIGLTGYNNIYEIEQQLNRELDQLFKPYGKVPKINNHLNMLEERYKQLKNSENEEMTYRDERKNYESLKQELNDLQLILEKKQEHKLTLEKWINSLPIIQDYYFYERQLNSFSRDVSFPERGIERLRAIQEQLLPIESEYSVYVANEKKLTQSYKTITQQLFDHPTYARAKVIAQSQRVFEKNQEEQRRYQQSIDKLQLEIDSKLDQLQIGLTTEEIQTITLPFYIEQQWNMCKREFDRLNNLIEQVKEQENELTQQKELIITELDETENRLLIDDERLELQKKVSAFTNYNDQLQLQKKTSQQNEDWNKLKQNKKKEQKNFLILSILLSGLFGGAGYLFNTFLYNVTIIFIIIGIGQFIWGKRSLRETDYLLKEKSLGLPASLHVSEQEKVNAENILKQDDHLKETIELIKRDVRQIDIQLLTCKEKLNTINGARVKNNKFIKEQCQQYPFLNKINVTYWPELFYPVRNIIEMIDKMTNLTNTIEQFHEQEVKLLKELHQLLRELSLNDQLELSIIKKYEYIIDLVSTHENLLLQKEQLIQDQTENKQRQQDLSQKVIIYKNEIDALFAIANVDSEEEFYEREKEHTKKRELTTALAKSKEQLQMNFSLEELKKQLQEQELNHHQLKAQLQNVTDEISTIQNNINKKQEEQSEIYAQLLKLESSETSSELRHRFMLEKEQLDKLAREWSVLKTAKDTLTQTKQSYQMNYLTKVIDQMTIYFKRITNNAYLKVFAPTDEQPFQVESATGIYYQVNELSQGTIDQLYISLRLAMGEIASKNQNLPFIIDDAFVHFDSIRLKRILNIIASIAEKQQVIVLTCKKEIVEYLEVNHIVNADKLGPVSIN